MNIIKHGLRTAAIGGLLYLSGLYLIHLGGLDFSSISEWWFRGVLVFFVLLSIVVLKAQNNGFLNFEEGFKVGMVTTCFLTVFIAISTWLYCDYLNPMYTENYEKEYRSMHYEKMMRKQIAEGWNRDTITQGAIDTVQRGLDLNVKKYVGHLFTTAGQVQSNFLYSFFWGIMITLTVALLARKVDEET
ncbi:MAG: Ca2+/Na+ antiporter [Aureispira sp.]|jgi:Ca2+/Na+ antiporter